MISIQELTLRRDGSNGLQMHLRAGASGFASLFSVFAGYLCLKFKVVGKKKMFCFPLKIRAFSPPTKNSHFKLELAGCVLENIRKLIIFFGKRFLAHTKLS